MSKKILVVDDEMHLAKIIQFTLEHAGYRTSIAFDGGEALAMIQEENPDLVILDLMLPGVDGYKVCNILKKDANLKHIPVIILSARDFESEVLAEPVSADLLMQKPFNTEELLSQISRLMEN